MLWAPDPFSMKPASLSLPGKVTRLYPQTNRNDIRHITSPPLLQGRLTVLIKKSRHGLYDENSALVSIFSKSLPVSVLPALRAS